MFKSVREKKIINIINHLNEQLSTDINIGTKIKSNYMSYEIIVSELRDYYENFNYKEDKEKYLKAKLIVLESEKLNIRDSQISKDMTILLTIMLAFIAFSTTLLTNLSKSNLINIGSIISLIFFIFIFCIIFGVVPAIVDINTNSNNTNKKIAINLHKTIIEEQLNKIKGDKKKVKEETEREANEKLIKELKEIHKFLKYDNANKNIISAACNKIINNIF